MKPIWQEWNGEARQIRLGRLPERFIDLKPYAGEPTLTPFPQPKGGHMFLH
jgi:hypothetical protein